MSPYIKTRGNQAFVLRDDVDSQATLAVSNQLLDLVNQGCRFPQNPLLRMGKRRYRMCRERDVERELEIDELLGLTKLQTPRFENLGRGHVVRHLPDWELLNTWRCELMVEIIDRHPVEIPINADGRPRAFLVPRQVRCLCGWSQSFLEKYANQCPGLLKEPGKYGERWAVETIPFLSHFGDPAYPFMPPRTLLTAAMQAA